MAFYGKLTTNRGEVYIEKEICKGCSFCVEFCPKNILEMSKEYNRKGYHHPRAKEDHDCIHCQLCAAICPEFAIHVVRKDEEE